MLEGFLAGQGHADIADESGNAQFEWDAVFVIADPQGRRFHFLVGLQAQVFHDFRHLHVEFDGIFAIDFFAAKHGDFREIGGLEGMNHLGDFVA